MQVGAKTRRKQKIRSLREEVWLYTTLVILLAYPIFTTSAPTVIAVIQRKIFAYHALTILLVQLKRKNLAITRLIPHLVQPGKQKKTSIFLPTGPRAHAPQV